MNIWPITQRPIVPFDLLQEDNVLRSDQTNGVVIKRLRFPTMREKAMGPFTWHLTETDYESLMDFYANNAALPFNFTYYTRTRSVTKKVTFSEPPKRTYVGGKWHVQCTFEEA